MSLFQHSVLNKYLKEANQTEIKSAFEKLVEYFHNPVIQQNIRESKEEQFQEGFLTEFFVKILGYTINPNPDYNLTTEFKNERGAKKADGAILKEGVAIGVIELKSTKTKDLESIRLQAFDYKANQSKCIYVITSNFEKIRFYINNAVDFEEFDLFKIKYEQFQLLWLCLAKENLLKNIPLVIKEASLLKEENVTKKIYVDYTAFKRDLYNNLIEKNLGLEIFKGKDEKEIKMLLFKKSQKLLDRFLFIFFGEDRGLLPPNSISEILKQWEQLKDLDEYKPLYERYKKYFSYLNKGWKGKKHEIFAYNGGLFAPDEILENIKIDDEILQKHTKVLTAYDFETEVDVNILGHIFENSLNEIEEVAAQIEGAEIDLKKSKRKKDGVFYTPKYITKYIVENTVGKLCIEKKTELGIEESEYLKNRKGRTTKKLKELNEKLTDYRNWLLTLTICDPACGSGAFLNQALDFLINEHRYIDELKAKLLGVPMIFTEVENSILENNIYGVDINEESVEIAKLSLWLRTAQKGRKLTTLSNNIKCGNSLIDDPEVAGEKAFNWQNEFPDIFRKKKNQIWHITTATHNSRYSQRMFDNKIKTDAAIWLSENDEIQITKTIAEIVKKDGLHVLEYNICGDHLHLLLVCEKQELTKIVGKIKAVSARKYNRWTGITTESGKGTEAIPGMESEPGTGTRGHVPLSEIPPTGGEISAKKKYNSLWTQKFGKSEIKDEDYLENAVKYIRKNRVKHQLPKSKKIEKIKREFLTTRKNAFSNEYSGGFDVVIGNPPYVSSKEENFPEVIKAFLTKKYSTAVYQIDLYILFIEKSIQLQKSIGLCSFIIPNAWLNNLFLKVVRKYILEHSSVIRIVSMPANTFADANVDTVILTLTKPEKKIKTDLVVCKNEQFFVLGKVEQDIWLSSDNFTINVHATNEISRILNKIRKQQVSLSTFTEIARGVGVYHKRVGHTKELIAQNPYQSKRKEDESFVPYLRGKNVNLWNITWDNDSFISYGKWLAEPREPKYFEGDRIVLRQIPSKRLIATFIQTKFITDQSVFIARFNDNSEYNAKAVLSLITSKLFSFYFRYFYSEFDELFPKIKLQHFKDLPIHIKLNSQANRFTKVAEIRLELSNKYIEIQTKFIKYLNSQISFEAINKKLQNWHELEFTDFIKELNKAIKKAGGSALSKIDEMEWMELFETKKAEAQTLKAEIDKTDREIDQMVYELYGLTEEEIGIVEHN